MISTRTQTRADADGGAFLPRLRSQLAERIAEQNRLKSDIDAVLAPAKRFQRDLNADEARRFEEIDSRATAVRAEVARLNERIAELEALEARQREAASRHSGVGYVTGEARTYTAHSANREGVSFLRDIVNAQLGDWAAAERLQRHAREAQVESRAIGTGAVAGIVPPQYLTDLVAELARAGRPLANAATSHALPESGLTVNISRVTTGTAVTSQASENATVQNTDLDDTLLTINVNTIAGQQVVSRQAIERGVGVDQLVFADLALAYATELDRQLINGSGASGQHLGILGTSGINSITYTDATPSVAELWPKIADAANQVATTTYLPADVIVMHPRRWAWMVAALDTTTRPLLDTAGSGTNTIGTSGANVGSGAVGTLQGLRVLLDSSMPINLGAGTNEDRIIIANSRELHLWEAGNAAPASIRAEQPNAASLGVVLVVYGYSAFTAGRRPGAVSVISGTGLVTPTL